MQCVTGPFKRENELLISVANKRREKRERKNANKKREMHIAENRDSHARNKRERKNERNI